MNDAAGSSPVAADILPLVDRIKRNDDADQELRQASSQINILVNGLPTTDDLLVEDRAITYWRVLRDKHPQLYRIYLSKIRGIWAHRGVADIIEGLVGPPAAHQARRDIALLTPTEVRARPVPLDLVRDLVPSRGVACCVGASGSGKSFLMFDLGATVARGVGRWFGKRASSGGVIYIGAEGSWNVRQQAYEQHHGVSLDDVPIRIIEQAVDLLRSGAEGDIDRLIELISEAAAEMGGVVLIIIDTLNRTMPGGNENAPDDMGAYIQNVARLAEAISALVIVIHHTGKNESAGARGHSSLYGALDCELTVSKDSGGVRSFRTSKQRDGADDLGAAFRLDVVDVGPHPHPQADPDERLASCVIVPAIAAERSSETRPQKLTNDERIALDALKEVIAQAGHKPGHKLPATSVLPSGVVSGSVEAWRVRFYGRLGADRADTTQDAKSKAFRRGLSGLVAKKLVGVWEEYAWIW